VVFCGNPEFAVPVLDRLLTSRHSVVAAVASPDKPRGRGRKLSPLPVKERALAARIPVMQPVSLRDAEFLSDVRALDPDCLVVVAFRILPRELFALPRLGSFNVHPSLLPRGRGPAPIRWTLLRGERETGVTIIRLSETVDGGDILRQERTAVGDDEDFGSLHDRLAQTGAGLLLEVLDAFESGTPPEPMPQDETQVTTAPKLRAADFELDWNRSAHELNHHIRALSPFPGAATRWNGGRFKILQAEIATSIPDVRPSQVQADPKGGLVVGTGQGALKLKRVQAEGKRVMTVEEFLRGRPSIPDCLGE